MGDDRPIAYMESAEDGPWIILRASGLGGCTRDHVLHLLGNEPLATPPELQKRFDAGIRAEPKILGRMVEDGWVFQEGSAQKEEELTVLRPVEDKPGVKVRYHPDGIAMPPERLGISGPRVIEAKALAVSSFQQATSKGTGSLFGYDWQLSVMMLNTGLPAIWVALCKNPDGEQEQYDGLMHLEYVEQPPRSKVEVLQRAKWVRDWFLKGEAPECSNPDQYPCPFLYLRPEKEDTREWVELGDEEAETFAQMAGEYATLTAVVAKGAAADKERKAIKKALDEIAAGRLAVKGNGWRMVTTVKEMPKMVATNDKYETRTIKVEQG